MRGAAPTNFSRLASRLSRIQRYISKRYDIAIKNTQFEEEALSHYDSSRYFPARIGQVFNDRYKIVGKLGFGGSSTVWLSEDTTRGLVNGRDNRYKTLKIGVASKLEDQEVKVLKYLKASNSRHDGRYIVRRAEDNFNMQAKGSHHHCLVYEPLGMSLLDHETSQADHILPAGIIKWVMIYLLMGKDYLHTSGVVHTDIKLDNVQYTLPEEGSAAIFADYVQAEYTSPSHRKVIDEVRTIYMSRPFEFGNAMTFPIICDLGMGVFGQQTYDGVIQAIPHRAPEVILRMKWDFKLKIWNVGVLVWELLSGVHLFGNYDEQTSLATMISHLGPPPLEFLNRSPVKGHFFDDQGAWKSSSITSEALADKLEGNTDLLLDFLKSTLAWKPEDRKTAHQLLDHVWLKP